jgi:tetratricopeptide (TPR) repeat protein/transcriptional regulator with XRE-family HTH domain
MGISGAAFGSWLRLWAGRLGQDYSAVARGLNLDKSSVNRWWHGKRGPRKDDIARLVVYLWQRGAIREPTELLQALEDVNLELPAFVEAVRDTSPTDLERHRDFLAWLDGRRDRYISLERQRIWRPPVFVARTEEITAIRAALLNEEATSVALWGMGGSGKTALARAVAELPEIKETYWGGTLWAAPGPDSQWLPWLERWCRALKLAPPKEADEADLQARIADYLAVPGRKFLIVVDDVWAVAALAPLLHHGRPSRLLITTRDRAVATALPDAALIEVGPMAEPQGVDLLRTHAGRAQVAQEPAGRAAELVQIVESMPLAVTLLGKLVNLKGWERVREEARDARRRLPALRTDAGNTRETSVRAALGLSYASLGEDARWRLRQLAVFPFGAGIGAVPVAGIWGLVTGVAEAADILAEAQSGLEFLFARGLLQRSDMSEDGPERFQFHTLVHDYAAGLLRTAEAGEEETARQRYVKTYLYLSQRLSRETETEPAVLAAEWPNIARAFDYAFDAGAYDICTFLLHAMQSHLLLHLHVKMLDGWLSRLAAHVDSLSPEALGILEHAQARHLYAQQRWPEARRHMRAALIAPELEPRLKAFLSLEELGACLAEGNWQGATVAFEEARQQAGSEDDPEIRLALSKGAAALAEGRGEWQAALNHLEEVARLAGFMRRPGEVADAYCRAGGIYRRVGDIRATETYLVMSLDVATANQLLLSELNALVELAPVEMELEKPEAARRAANRLLAILQGAELIEREAAARKSFAYQILAAAATIEGQLDEALSMGQTAVRLSETARAVDVQAEACEVLMMVHAQRGDTGQVEEAARQAIRLYQATGAPERAARVEKFMRSVQGRSTKPAP